MTPNQWNRNTRDSVVRLLTQAGFSEDSSVINQLECMNFDEPAEPAQPQSDSVIVPRELLDRFPEINMANFGADEVELLNDWGIEVSLLGGEA